MIRKFEQKDLEEVMKIWLDTNIQAHDFIPDSYWKDNFEAVQSMIPEADVYIYESNGKVIGFVGIKAGYLAGIFVSQDMQSSGIGKQLLDKAKELYPDLSLSVYKKNKKAIDFYIREMFVVEKVQVDEDTGEEEYYMIWKGKYIKKDPL